MSRDIYVYFKMNSTEECPPELGYTLYLDSK